MLYGVAIPDEVVITENGLKFAVDLANGHKTGFYLDQRDNRTEACARRYVADGDVLNVLPAQAALASMQR